MKTFSRSHPLSRLARLCAAAVLASASVACGGAGADRSPPAPISAPAPAPVAVNAPAPVQASGPSSGAIMDKLKAEIGEAACDTAAQCKTVAVGSKACGGPEGYLAYSTKNGNGAKITQMAAEDAAARKASNERSGMVSNCMMAMDPGAVCTAGRCVTGSGSDLPVR